MHVYTIWLPVPLCASNDSNHFSLLGCLRGCSTMDLHYTIYIIHNLILDRNFWRVVSTLSSHKSLCSEHTYSDHSWGCLPQPGTKRRGEGIRRMEDAGTSEEDDDIDRQDSNTPIDHSHLARNCSIKIITPAMKASVSSMWILAFYRIVSFFLLMFEVNLKDST